MAIIVAGVWVNVSKFVRNEVLLKAYGMDHYRSLGMTFPAEMKNGLIWVAWGFLYAVISKWTRMAKKHACFLPLASDYQAF